MSTLAEINSTDIIANSQADIQANFEALNTDKTENSDLQIQAHTYAISSGLGDAYTVSISPAPIAYVEGLGISFRAYTDNSGPATLAVGTLGAITIKKGGSADLENGDIVTGQIINVVYDGEFFQIVGGSGSSSGSASFWSAVPGAPARSSDTQFTIADASNVNLYDKLFSKGVILKWLEGSTFQTGMIVSSSYSSGVVTINIVGDSLGSNFSALNYCLHMAKKETFIIPGTLGTGTDLAKTFYPENDIYKFSVDARDKTAGTTNPTVFDVNDDGVTIMTTKPSIASATTSDLDNTVDSASTLIAKDSAVTVDIDSVSTTAPVEAYIDLFYYPVSWRYRT